MNTTSPITALRNIWSQIKLSLNDPQWGRKPGSNVNNSNDSPSDESSDDNAPAPSSNRPEPTRSNNGNRGGRSSGGPPDLDEIAQKVKDRLNSLLGGKKRRPNGRNGGGPQMPNFGPQFATSGMLIIGLIGILIWLSTGIYVVDDGKRGIIQRFGKYVDTTEAGLHWHFPWPIEKHTIIDLNRVRSLEIGSKGGAQNRDARQSQMLTADLNIIDIAFAVQYTLTDARAYLFNNRNPDEAVVQAAETAMREIVGKRKMDFLLNQGREEFSAATKELMQQLLDRYNTGISISQLNLQAVAAPEAVIDAFQDVVRAQQDRDRQVNEGQAYANRVVPEARGRASRLLEEASGYEQSVVARAQGDAARFSSILSEYSKAPAVTRERLYLDMMQSILSNSSKILVDQKQGQSLLYLPLDKLMEQTRDAATASTVTTNVPTSSSSAEGTRPTTDAVPPSPTTSENTRTTNQDSVRNVREIRNGRNLHN